MCSGDVTSETVKATCEELRLTDGYQKNNQLTETCTHYMQCLRPLYEAISCSWVKLKQLKRKFSFCVLGIYELIEKRSEK